MLRNRIQMPGGLSDAQFEKDSRQSFRSRNWLTSPWNILAFTADYQLNHAISLSLKSTFQYSERSLVWKNEDGGPEEADSISPVTNTYVQREVEHELFMNMTHELRMSANYNLGKTSHTLAGGVRYFEGKMKREGGGPGSTGTDFDLNLYGGDYEYALNFHTRNVAVFAENIFRVTDKWSIVPGIRYEMINSSANGYITDSIAIPVSQAMPRRILLTGVGTKYQLSTGTQLYANWSESYRPMDYSALTPLGVSSRIDPNMKDVSGYNADCGWRGNFGRFLNFDLGLFYMQCNNRIGILLLTDPVTGNPYTMRTNTGNSVSKGVESYVEFNPVRLFTNDSKIGYLHLFNSFAWIDARYTSGTDESGSSLKGNHVEFAPEFINRTGVTYGIRSFSATFNTNYTSSSFTDAANTVSSSDAIVGVIPAYTVYDLSATYGFRNFKIRAGVNNIADSRYFTKRTDEYPGPGIIPAIGRTFYLGFSAKF